MGAELRRARSAAAVPAATASMSARRYDDWWAEPAESPVWWMPSMVARLERARARWPAELAKAVVPPSVSQ
jgi:hypothetical protein